MAPKIPELNATDKYMSPRVSELNFSYKLMASRISELNFRGIFQRISEHFRETGLNFSRKYMTLRVPGFSEKYTGFCTFLSITPQKKRLCLGVLSCISLLIKNLLYINVNRPKVTLRIPELSFDDKLLAPMVQEPS